MVNLALSAFVLRSTTKNTGRQLFEGKKCHLPPPRKNPGYAYGETQGPRVQADAVVVSLKRYHISVAIIRIIILKYYK